MFTLQDECIDWKSVLQIIIIQFILEKKIP